MVAYKIIETGEIVSQMPKNKMFEIINIEGKTLPKKKSNGNTTI